MRVLVVDDEQNIRLILAQILMAEGYQVLTAASGEEALDLLRDTFFELLVVDLRLGGRVDGHDLLEKVRWRWPETVVIILTAYASLDSALTAIREGVDGYLKKPVSREEFLQAVREALDRRRRLATLPAPEEPARLAVGVFEVDLLQHQARRAGQLLELTPAEFRLLVYLLQHPEQVLTPLELVKAVQGYAGLSESAAREIVKWYVHSLRRKVEPDPARPCFILNVRGVGYRLRPEGALSSADSSSEVRQT